MEFIKKLKKINPRIVILLIFFGLFTIFSLRHFILGGKVAASVDALCPFGGFETLYTFIATGGFVPRVLISSLILALGVLLTVLIFNRGFCGWICPFGALQDFMFNIGKFLRKTFGSGFNKNKRIEKFSNYIKNNIIHKKDSIIINNLKFMKYLILFIILVGTAITGTLVFRNYDPFVTFFHFGKGLFWSIEESESFLPFIILLIILVISLFVKRFFCRFLCPLGATTAIFSRFSLSKINRDKKTCIDCKICDKKCPVKINVSTVDIVNDTECISCLECVRTCPKKSLSMKITKKKDIGYLKYVMLLISLFFLVIIISKGIGIWTSVPVLTVANSSMSMDEILEKFDTESIKGWMSIKDVSDSTGIPVKKIISDIGLPENIDVNLPLKDIMTKTGIDFETEDIREYILKLKKGENVNSIFTENIEAIKSDCPWELYDDPYPGRCGLYVDSDSNRICDLSE